MKRKPVIQKTTHEYIFDKEEFECLAGACYVARNAHLELCKLGYTQRLRPDIARFIDKVIDWHISEEADMVTPPIMPWDK